MKIFLKCLVVYFIGLFFVLSLTLRYDSLEKEYNMAKENNNQSKYVINK